MNNLQENEAFYYGLICGINLYQRKVLLAHKKGEPILIGDMIYYLQDGRERLQEMFEKICK